MSDEQIGKALAPEIIQDKLREAHRQPTRHSPRLPDPLATELTSDEEKSTVTEIKEFSARQNKLGDTLEKFLGNILAAITPIIFKEMAGMVFNDGITLPAIGMFVFLVAMLVVKWLCQESFVNIIKDILQWTMDYLTGKPLD